LPGRASAIDVTGGLQDLVGPVLDEADRCGRAVEAKLRTRPEGKELFLLTSSST